MVGRWHCCRLTAIPIVSLLTDVVPPLVKRVRARTVMPHVLAEYCLALTALPGSITAGPLGVNREFSVHGPDWKIVPRRVVHEGGLFLLA